MRNKQVLIIPLSKDRKPKNMVWEDVLDWLHIDNEKLQELIDSGEPYGDYCFDEALIYDSKLS